MKKLLMLICALLIAAMILTSCDLMSEMFGNNGGTDVGGENSGNTDGEGNNGGNTEGPGQGMPDHEDDPGTPGGENNPDTPGENQGTENPDGNEGENQGGGQGTPGGDVGGDEDENKYTYTDFTASEKQLFKDYLGEVIPFVPNNDYCVEEYSYDYDDSRETGLNFYTFGNTKADFEAYRALFSDYTYDGTENDEYGDAWYYYTADSGYYVDMSFYYYEGDYVIDVYAYTLTEYDDGSGDVGGDDTRDFLYNDFSSAEKSLFTEYFGEVIPFLLNDEYYVEEYTLDYEDGEYEEGINFYVFGATEMQFDLYRALYSGYTNDGTDTDEYGDTWYYYTAKSGFFVDMSYYMTDDGEYVVDVYAYFVREGSLGGGDIGGGDVGGGTETPDANVITNAGAGLPQGTDGIYNVDFTDGKYVKDVTDQGYYLDGCPTVGSPAVLVIPIDFSDVGAAAKGYSIENIVRAFTGGAGETDYYSVKDYYYISSYGKLDLDITVIDEWFVPKNASTYYENATIDYYGDTIYAGDQMILDEALAYLSGFMDLSEFDSDNNGIIDAVVMINSLDIDPDSDFYWAYRYWNMYTDDEGYYYEYDGVSANDYLWASYSFMHESYDELGEAIYTDTSVMNTYTYIHEFGHVLGADDYYDTSDAGVHPLDGCDMMDGMSGDHNPYTKFNYGWLTASRLVTTDNSITLTLNSFTKTGDSIIIANNFDPELGAYQEYYVVIYYTQDGLNGGEYGYFAREGVVVYHVNASLYSEDYEGTLYYDVYNNNTSASNEYGTYDNLIELVKSTEGNFTYIEGDSIPAVKDDQGNALCYGFTVDSIDEDTATVTFTKK